jgi:hypothetical protein
MNTSEESLYSGNLGMKHIFLILAAILFLSGFISGGLALAPEGASIANPFKSFIGVSPERPSPSNWVVEDSINVYDDRVVIFIDDPYWSKFLDTNSMDPLLDIDSNAIQIKPSSPSRIQVGDVISYSSEFGIIIHRVIETGTDGDGWYAIVKGDNNAYSDPDKVRFEQVERVLVAVIY